MSNNTVDAKHNTTHMSTSTSTSKKNDDYYHDDYNYYSRISERIQGSFLRARCLGRRVLVFRVLKAFNKIKSFMRVPRLRFLGFWVSWFGI